MSNQTTLGQRITAARKRAGLKQAEIGRLFGISREAVSLWESDTNAPTADKLGRLALETAVNVQWLMTGIGPMEGERPAPATQPSSATEDGRRQLARMAAQDVPVVGAGRASRQGIFEFNGEIIDHVPRPANLAGAPNAYAIHVTGPSMEPRYFEGELLYVHPGKPVLPGSFVVVQYYKDEVRDVLYAVIKQFVNRGEKVSTFRQFNPKDDLKIPTKDILAVHRIVGMLEG